MFQNVTPQATDTSTKLQDRDSWVRVPVGGTHQPQNQNPEIPPTPPTPTPPRRVALYGGISGPNPIWPGNPTCRVTVPPPNHPAPRHLARKSDVQGDRLPHQTTSLLVTKVTVSPPTHLSWVRNLVGNWPGLMRRRKHHSTLCFRTFSAFHSSSGCSPIRLANSASSVSNSGSTIPRSSSLSRNFFSSG